ncbi:hypothetical protein K7X08_019912 [Anisodus acutangulus]|uniref:tRNA nucleotidyltransferase/poly(A) polymerase RNA and SrmB- binding domain-containing protein n=1 Tax=Anisodus acutangulus TaxID=402998 RepID=A0A9Q1RQG3_9SOLA|nr:hypothetical protein K7X08_019912 [Anisodus acutangulus]
MPSFSNFDGTDPGFSLSSARILRGLRLAARLKLSFSEVIESAMHKLSSSIMRLDKSRLMMEINYMLSYGAAQPSLSLLQRYNMLGMLLPFHKLFSSLDQLVTCGRPSHDSLWVALLAFHLALITDPQEAFVVLTFASALYHGDWKEDSQGSISDDELVERVTELAVLVQNSIDILTDKDSLQEAMSKFPGSEVIRHTLVKVDAQLSKDATEENIGGSVEFKKRKFVCEDDNQPNTSYEIKHNRAEKRKSVIAKQSKE